MVLEEALKEKQVITNYLGELADLHEKVLLDPARAFQLEKVRGDVELCFEGLASLNDSISGHHGEIKQEISNLQKLQAEIVSLTEEEFSLLRELELWECVATDVSSATSTLQADPESSSTKNVEITIGIRYKPLMDKYLKLSNTEDGVKVVDRTQSSGRDRKPTDERQNIVDTLSTLESSYYYIQNDIKRVEALLKELKRDKSFLAEEMRKQRSIIRTHKVELDAKLKDVEARKSDVLHELGLKPHTNERKLGRLESSLFNISFHGQSIRIDEREAESKATLALVKQYVAVRLESLDEQLRNFKDEAPLSVTKKEIWSDCVRCVTQLESHLAELLPRDTQQISSGDILSTIRQCVKYLDDLLGMCGDPVLTRLITNEKKSLIIGYEDLSVISNTPVEDGLPSDQCTSNSLGERREDKGEI